jgi:hypothetical protein
MCTRYVSFIQAKARGTRQAGTVAARDENEQEKYRPVLYHIPVLNRSFSFFRENEKTVREPG